MITQRLKEKCTDLKWGEGKGNGHYESLILISVLSFKRH